MRPWFKRMWVLQEIALAQRENAIVQCGRKRIQWRDLVVFRSILRERKGAVTDMMIPDQREGVIFADATLGLFSSGILKKRGTESLQILLTQTHLYAGQDSRDKIYALKALTDDPGLTVPDCKVPANELFEKTTRLCIEQHDSLNLLNLPSQRTESDWTSWAVGFETKVQQAKRCN